MANLYHNSDISFDYIVKAIKNPKMRTYSGKIIKMLKLMQSIFRKNAPNIISEHTYPHQVFPYKAYEPKEKINRFHRSMAPMYTTSTPSMVATYTYVLLWELIISGRFLEFNSIADPLSYTGHVSNDPMFHYLFGLCKQVQAIYLYTELQHITNVIDLEVAIDKIIVLIDEAKTFYRKLKTHQNFSVDLNQLYQSLDNVSQLLEDAKCDPHSFISKKKDDNAGKESRYNQDDDKDDISSDSIDDESPTRRRNALASKNTNDLQSQFSQLESISQNVHQSQRSSDTTSSSSSSDNEDNGYASPAKKHKERKQNGPELDEFELYLSQKETQKTEEDGDDPYAYLDNLENTGNHNEEENYEEADGFNATLDPEDSE
ncbi:unnamed protein product [Ambrosiozyma monospora]|uniref:Unnamed protein product n=1 Tax=Ambrosiozyma monospora TaxID=43982 RepID=A0A9W7DJV4_AMBMO|nr:unnamed protein product [Ambrosiozyma monospora]